MAKQFKPSSKGDYYVVARGMIVTANNDFSVPLNSRVLATVDGDQVETQEMLHRANTQPELLGALKDITDRFEAAIEATYATRTDRVEIRAARAAIAKATQ